MDPATPTATAVAIKDTRIVWIGDQKNIDSWKGENTHTIDLQGCFVYPGFIDTQCMCFTPELQKSICNWRNIRIRDPLLQK